MTVYTLYLKSCGENGLSCEKCQKNQTSCFSCHMLQRETQTETGKISFFFFLGLIPKRFPY